MTGLEFIHNLAEEYPDDDAFDFEGKCHDCKKDVHVAIEFEGEGIRISGGAVYSIGDDKIMLRCNDCFHRSKLLTGFQECEVYSRVVGYLRPVKQWNDGKQSEFRKRTPFRL